MSKNKDYMGDGVYADFDGFSIILTTENGVETMDTIVLEPEVLDAIIRYRDRMKASPRDGTGLD